MSYFIDNVQVKILDPRAAVPTRGSEMAAGYDLVACINEPLVIRKGDKATLIPTGLAMFMNDSLMAGLILPRSGLGHKQGLVLGNAIGLVDGDYQNEWFVSAWNRGQQDEIVINPGDRIAQVIFVPVIHPELTVVDEFSSETERGMGGFGSTGVETSTRNETAAELMERGNAILSESPFNPALHTKSTGPK